MGANERDEWLRAAWRTLVAGAIDARRLVFVDEMGTNTSLYPRYAYSPKGRRAHSQVPRNRGKTTTLLAKHDDRRNGTVCGGGRPHYLSGL